MKSINGEYVRLLSNLMAPGVGQVSPRGMPVRELLAYQSCIDMSDPRVTIDLRKVHEPFRYGEAAWMLAGDNRVSTIRPFNKNITPFADDGHRYFGAYGPKVVDQLSYCANKLIQDNSTRQAVINIWRENPPATKDVPCTLSLQFLARNGTLNLVSTMRSSDAWLGWPYDVFNFSMVAWALCIYVRQLGGPPLLPGRQFLTVGSQHIYEKHFEQARGVLNRGEEDGSPIRITGPTAFETVDDFVGALAVAAHEELAAKR